ncbi:MTAP family purine nucleoside phosphorylase [Candidatus Micrarchaeota archaeon]|nr:MTAP family purine nucleoside phosphorylase [Candidatus Micrarchaeota archaeon]
MLGIIGGSGIYSIGKFEEQDINTPYGFAQVYLGKIGKRECAFIPRHGKNHFLPSYKINYRANIWALKDLGVEGTIATYACGAISKYKPGDFVAAEDFIGFNSPISFYENFRAGIKHADASEPFSKDLNANLVVAGKPLGIKMKKGGIIAVTQGPRYETRAEIKALKRMGANLVNMSCGYEAALLLEAEIPLAGLCIVTNYAAGISKKALSHDEVVNMMSKKTREVNGIIMAFAELL